MKLDLISSQMTGIYQALTNLDLVLTSQVRWIRQPARINGMWRASIWV